MQMDNENEFDSDHGGTLTGEESNMGQKLMHFDEEIIQCEMLHTVIAEIHVYTFGKRCNFS